MTNADGRQEEQQRGAEDRLEKAVRAAERALIEFEIAVETFRVEVENFSRLHHQRLGPMYTRLDELDALIAEAIAARSGDREDIRQAWEARALVMPMPGVEELFEGLLGSDGVRHTEDPTAPRRVRPSEEARRLYRELARKVHPDLAQDEDEQKRRGEFLARVNEAYADGDESALRALAVEWEAGPPPEEVPPSRAEELYARLEWLALRKETLAAVATELENSAIGQMLRGRVRTALAGAAEGEAARTLREQAAQDLRDAIERVESLVRLDLQRGSYRALLGELWTARARVAADEMECFEFIDKALSSFRAAQNRDADNPRHPRRLAEVRKEWPDESRWSDDKRRPARPNP